MGWLVATIKRFRQKRIPAASSLYATVKRLQQPWVDAAWKSFFTTFDQIACIQIENYLRYQDYLPQESGRVFIHLMSLRIQYDRNPYRDCDVERPYQLVTFLPGQQHELECFPRERSRFVEVPLLLSDSTVQSPLPVVSEETTISLAILAG